MSGQIAQPSLADSLLRRRCEEQGQATYSYSRLRLHGLVRFGGGVDGWYARKALGFLLLHPASEDVLLMIDSILARPYSFAGDLYRAFRTEDDSGVLSAVAAIEIKSSKRALDQMWSWRLMKAIALLNMGRTEEAKQWYADEMEVRNKILGDRFKEGHLHFLSHQDVYLLEAKKAFQDRGLLE